MAAPAPAPPPAGSSPYELARALQSGGPSLQKLPLALALAGLSPDGSAAAAAGSDGGPGCVAPPCHPLHFPVLWYWWFA